jgi:hypothetical protein
MRDMSSERITYSFQNPNAPAQARAFERKMPGRISEFFRNGPGLRGIGKLAAGGAFMLLVPLVDKLHSAFASEQHVQQTIYALEHGQDTIWVYQHVEIDGVWPDPSFMARAVIWPGNNPDNPTCGDTLKAIMKDGPFTDAERRVGLARGYGVFIVFDEALGDSAEAARIADSTCQRWAMPSPCGNFENFISIMASSGFPPVNLDTTIAGMPVNAVFTNGSELVAVRNTWAFSLIDSAALEAVGVQPWRYSWSTLVHDTLQANELTARLPVGRIPFALPSGIELKQNYPNPFNSTTTIEYEIPKRAFVKIRVYDVTGRRVATLVDGTKTAGRYSTVFKTDGLPSGTYLYRFEADGISRTKKMTLVK